MNTKNILRLSHLLFFQVILITNSFSQTPPAKQWDADFGGISADNLVAVQQTSDGGYILGGWSNSGISGDKTQPGWDTTLPYAADYWIVKTDSNGLKQWDARFGGIEDDYLSCIQQTSDGGYILGGYSLSGKSGDKTHHNWSKTWDYWIVKIDAGGTKQWDADFGGTAADWLQTIQQTSDGGYILGGYSDSGISGDKTQVNKGYFDYWIVKTDRHGIKQWDATFGGNTFDYLKDLQQTADGSYILGGYSGSDVGGDKTQSSQGLTDYWIVKTDANGIKEWDADFGGIESEYFSSIQQSADGGYILGGYSYSDAGGDKTQPSQGEGDYWIVKTDANGSKEWDARFGGSSEERLYDLIETSDSGYVFGGVSYSDSSGDKSQDNRGVYDYWIVKTNNHGVKQWDMRFGGTDEDGLLSLQQTSHKGFILGGYSYSGIGGDKSQANKGSSDFWIVKLQQEKSSAACIAPSGLQVINITSNSAIVSWNDAGADYYRAGYKAQGTGDDWKAIQDTITGNKIYNTQIEITGLSPATSYKWRVTSVCDGILVPAFGVNGPEFTTNPFRMNEDNDVVNESLKLSPNPAKGLITIEYFSKRNDQIELKIYDLIGKEKLSQHVKVLPGNNSLHIDCSGLISGSYFLEVRNADVVNQTRFILLH